MSIWLYMVCSGMVSVSAILLIATRCYVLHFFLTLHIPNDWKEVFGVLGDVAFDLLQVVHIQPKPGGVQVLDRRSSEEGRC